MYGLRESLPREGADMAKKKAPTPEQPFLDDIVAHAGDDTPRLVYADWLEDHGQAHRAEFIRGECQLAGLDEEDARRTELKEREWELLAVYRDEWAAELPSWARKGPFLQFRRGFVERVSVTASQLLKQGGALFAVAPIRDLHLRAAATRLAEVAACPHLARLSALDFTRVALTVDDLRGLTASPHLAGLTSLSLCQTHLLPEGVEVLARWPQLARLSSLHLGSNFLVAEAVLALAKAPSLEALEWLDLANPIMEAHGLRALLAGGRLAGLKHLGLASANLADAMAALVKPGELPRLTSLDGSGHWLGGEAVALLGESELLGQLTSLRLSGARIDAQSLRALVGPGRVSRLQKLDLSYNPLQAPDALAALGSAPLDALRSLDLTTPGVHSGDDAAAVRILAASPRLAGLRSLKLSGWQLGDAGARALAESPYLNLTHLNLHQTGIGPEGAAALAASPRLSRLRVLHLDRNLLGPKGVRALVSSPYLGNLSHLSLGITNLGDEGVRALASSDHLENLRHLNLWGYHSPDDSPLRELANSPRLPRLVVLKVQDVTRDSVEELRRLGRAIVV
jgi:uncharacterized protein (TIGR02996 family)